MTSLLQIDLTNLKYMQICMCFAMITQTVVSFTVFSFLQNISYIVLGLSLLSFLLMSFLYLSKAQMTTFGLVTVMFFSLLIIFTLINGTDLKNAIYQSMQTLLLLMLFYYFQNDLSIIVKSCALCFSLIIYFNLLLMILFPTWMFAADNTFDSYLLGGNYNQMGGRLMCGIITNVLCIPYGKRWLLNSIFLIFTSIVTLALPGSMTSLSCIILFTAVCLIPSKKLQLLATLFSFIGYLFFQCVIVFSGEGLHNNPLAVYFIKDVLHKDLTFTNRTHMWDAAGKVVSQSPLFGYGFVDREWYLSMMDSSAIGPHNFIYAILIYGGIILLAILLIMAILACKRLSTCFNRIAGLLLMAIVTLLIMLTMEVYPLFFFIYMLVLMYYYPEISNTWKRI